ncbi:MAG: amino acid ABC transporter substrate-binding protein, partial [Gammaproteobacteria bacterium]|jgi:branched-chain amino acid transport system substrate-binding protein
MSAIERAASAAPDAVRQALAATRDYRGVTGTIGYRGGSRIPAKSVTIMRVDGGRQTFVGSVLPQSIPAP